MKILLLGKDGQVGWELQRSLAPLGELVMHGRETADLADPVALRALIRDCRPDVIVNAGAYTAVDRAESDVELAMRVNAEAPGVIAEEAKACGAWFVHYSTDYVFDGRSNDTYDEDAVTNPQSVYGRTKQAGEAAIAASGCLHLILRTSWVFGARGKNFARTMLSLAKTREALSVVGDQIGAPTGADLIADVTALCIYRLFSQPDMARHSGIYHLTAAGAISWHGYAQFVIGMALAQHLPLRLKLDDVKSVSSAEYPTAATRPANSRLNTHKLRTTFGIALPDWEVHVRRSVSIMLSQEHKNEA